MKNKITDLRNHMFAQLERLGNEDLTPEDIEKEINRARAISELGKVIVESAKTEVLHLKLTKKLDRETPPQFLEKDLDEPKKLERPKAVYQNKQHLEGYEFETDEPKEKEDI